MPMKYETYAARLAAAGITPYRVAKDLNISDSAPTYWKDHNRVPGYAIFHLLTLESMSEAQKIELRRRLTTEK